MLGKKLISKLAAVVLAGIMVIGCGATVFADERIVEVEERNLYFRSYVSTQTFEFVPECTGDYIFRSYAPEASASRYVNPLIEVKQNGMSWLDFDSADGLNFKLRVHLEGGVPCRIFVQCDGYYTKVNVPVVISRVDNEPEPSETESELPALTEEQIREAKAYLKAYALVAYYGDGITEAEIDEALDELTVEELIEYCETLGYIF